MKLIYKIFVLLVFGVVAISNNVNANEKPLDGCYMKNFDVTGYYSPIQWQDFYYRWNFNSEIRLNWQGIAWASWKKVFNGMLAASPNYSFGTKVYFPDYGWGQIEDRGQAIVQAWVRTNSHDRIDIRMGHGTKWLIRALSFGKRTLKWFVCPSNKPYVWFDYWQFPVYNNFFKASLWWVGLAQWRNDKWVESLQYFLHQLGYVKKNHITGYFGPITKQAVCSFQQDQNIVYWSNCWYFGPKTRHSLKKALKNIWYITSNSYRDYYIPNKQDTENDLHKKEKQLAINQEDKEKNSDGNTTQSSKNEIVFNRSFQRGENSYEITELQKYLNKLGYYKGDLDGTYDMETIKAVYQFQLDHKVLDPNTDMSVKWYFGLQTRKKFEDVIASI